MEGRYSDMIIKLNVGTLDTLVKITRLWKKIPRCWYFDLSNPYGKRVRVFYVWLFDRKWDVFMIGDKGYRCG